MTWQTLNVYGKHVIQLIHNNHSFNLFWCFHRYELMQLRALTDTRGLGASYSAAFVSSGWEVNGGEPGEKRGLEISLGLGWRGLMLLFGV
jgi:hypothetical protein